MISGDQVLLITGLDVNPDCRVWGIKSDREWEPLPDWLIRARNGWLNA